MTNSSLLPTIEAVGLDLSLFQTYSRAIESLTPYMESLSIAPADESLNNNVLGRIFVSITDTFVGLLNTFKTNVFKFTKALKRSELREYVESNRLKTSVVNRLPYAKLSPVYVNIPANMQGTYLEAVTAIAALYVKLNAVSTAKTTLASFNKIFSSLTTKDPNAKKELLDTNTLLANIIKTSKPAVVECQNQFSQKLVAKKPYGNVFKTVKEFQTVTTELLSLESRLQDVSTLVDVIGQIETVLKGITTALSDPKAAPEAGEKPQLDQASLMVLGECAKGLALIFDSYGLATTRQMQLEHNHVLNFDLLYSQVHD